MAGPCGGSMGRKSKSPQFSDSLLGQHLALPVAAHLEALLQPPLVTSRIDQASRLAVSIARHAPHGRVANLAMQLMSALHEARGAGEIPASLGLVSSRLRAALDETTRPA